MNKYYSVTCKGKKAECWFVNDALQIFRKARRMLRKLEYNKRENSG